MRSYVTSVCVFVTTSILLIAICVLSCSAKMTKYLLQKEEGIILTRGFEGLGQAESIISDDFEYKVDEASLEAFNALTDEIYNKEINISKDEVTAIYYERVLDILKSKYLLEPTSATESVDAEGLTESKGEDSITLKEALQRMLPNLESGELVISDDIAPSIELNNGKVTLSGVKVDFNYGTSYSRENAFSVTTDIRDIVLYDENPEIFTYSMIAGKGIYVTGKTSTVMGNIYAGTHEPSEMRKAEALYGESGNFGGLNIMSTQVGFYGSKIVSEGDINMKGAFVVFGNEEHPMTLYADNVTQTDVIAARNIYALFGKESHDDINDVTDVIKEATGGFEQIDLYYDSLNDKSYTGKYRKIISSTDVTVKSDVTGVIMTPCSVIIEEGVNVEGLIICGDRIYVQGNNNIVSSVEVLRGILKEEIYEDIYAEDDSETLEEQSKNKIHLEMRNYLGGIKYRGME